MNSKRFAPYYRVPSTTLVGGKKIVTGNVTVETDRDSTNGGQYQLSATLGKGGYGTVFKAMDKERKAVVAIKLIPLFDQICLKELEILKTLHHQNIVQFKSSYTFTERNGSRNREMLAIVMEYCSKGTLKDKLKVEELLKKSIEVSQRFDWYKQLASAVEYMHNCGVIHRDLKPANILLADNGQLKIADVGIAKQVTECSVSSLDTPTHAHFAKTFVGTQSYMAPEIFTRVRYGMPCDVFSLGLVFWTIAELHPAGPQVMLTMGSKSISIGQFFCCPANYERSVAPTAYLYPQLKNSGKQELELMNNMLQARPEDRLSIFRVTKMLENFKLPHPYDFSLFQ